MIEEWKYSAKILIYHYRVVLKGMIPFAAPWDKKHESDLRHKATLDDEAMAYIRTLTRKVQDPGKSYFIHSCYSFWFILTILVPLHTTNLTRYRMRTAQGQQGGYI
jgi:hypothetical protein